MQIGSPHDYFHTKTAAFDRHLHLKASTYLKRGYLVENKTFLTKYTLIVLYH